jgi:nucleoside-diphosphate-sugar epimerase
MTEKGLPPRHPDVALITGSSGLIGAATVNRLAERFSVVGFDSEGKPHPPPAAECVCVDLTSDSSVQSGMERLRRAYGTRIASVIHLAAYYDFSGEPSPLYEELTVKGTERLLRALEPFEVEQLVFSSTMLVHAPTEPGRRIAESAPLEPKWDYPRSKVETERLISARRGKVPAVILRIAGVYDDGCHSIPLAHQIQRIHERTLTSRVFPGDTSRGQAFVHLDDVVEALALAVERRPQLPDEVVLLIGEPETVSYDELQRTLGRLIHGEEWETKQIPKALAKTGAWFQDRVPGAEPFIKPWMIDLADDHYELDVRRAREVLGWEPKRSLRETLPKMAAALQQDAERFYADNKLGKHPGAEPAPQAGAPAQEPAAPKDAGTGDDKERAEGGHSKGHGEMAPTGGEDHTAMLVDMRRKWLWTNATVATLGAWLLSSPFTFGYSQPAMAWNDVVSGALIMACAAAAFWSSLDFWGRWGAALVGTWLQFAPLVFWARDPAAYVTDTLVGALAIALTVLVPMMPGMAHHMAMMKPGPEVPPGWTYNPSTWHQRAPLMLLGLVGWFVSRYLAAVQLGYISAAWEPFFGEGTARVLHSKVSRMWPISDAGLGAAAYTFETLMAFMGGRARWRTMPWMVTFFGILVIPLGVTHIVLVILQPVVVGHWCTLCLLAASLMLAMIPLTVDEVVAMVQFLILARREGKSLWRTFWVGDTIEGGDADRRTPLYGAPIFSMGPATAWGVSLPLTLIASLALGLWMMFAPSVFGARGAVADSEHLTGALAVTFAAIALAEPIRALRFVNVALGAWITAAPFVLEGASTAGRWNAIVAGSLLVVLSLRRGAVRERYGSWDRFVV